MAYTTKCIVLSKTTALNIADMLETLKCIRGSEYPFIDRHIQELRGEI
jgi:hypothetical protein